MPRRAVAVLAVCLATLALPLTASNAAAPSWKGPTSLPTGSDPSATAQAVPDPAGGALLYYERSGVPTLSQVSATGTVGAATPIPSVMGLGDFGTPGQIAFLPNGGAVITWDLTSFGYYMAYRSPAGKFGTPVALPGFGIAVRTGEILSEGATGSGIEVDSWKLTAAGVITHKSGPTNVYTGAPYNGHNPVALSLDASGTADVIVFGSTDNGDTEQVAEAFRNAQGSWQPQTQLSAPAGYVTSVSFATSPGGRSAVAWVDAPTNLAATMSAAIRQPGHSFGASVQTGSVASANGAFLIPLVAAGADGTLAVATSSKVYTTPTAANTSTTVQIVAPTSSTLGSAHGVPGSNDALTLSSLGAGDSDAITGLVKAVYGPGDGTDAESYTESQATMASVISPSAASTVTLGSSSGTYDGDAADGCPCPTAPPTASITGVALDNHGLATAIGQLAPGGALSYAVRGGSAPAKPKISVTAAKAKATATKIPLTLACAKAACKGTLTLSAKVKKKTTKLATSSYSIAAGNHKTINAKLTKAGKKALKGAKKHPVKATLVVTVKGGATNTTHISVS